jgi:hypothetical protein
MRRSRVQSRLRGRLCWEPSSVPPDKITGQYHNSYKVFSSKWLSAKHTTYHSILYSLQVRQLFWYMHSWPYPGYFTVQQERLRYFNATKGTYGIDQVKHPPFLLCETNARPQSDLWDISLIFADDNWLQMWFKLDVCNLISSYKLSPSVSSFTPKINVEIFMVSSWSGTDRQNQKGSENPH